MQLSHKYEVERMELKQRMNDLQQRLTELSAMQQNKDSFISAVRKFMEMRTLTPALLHELIDHIEIHEAQGSGKSRTQHIAIYYRFVGYVEIPECSYRDHYKTEVRQGVAMEYIPNAVTA